ncbi:MAG: M6 family metalloprotease domain-containing protein [Bacteroidales bacterium]
MKAINYFISLFLITFLCNYVFAVPADKTQIYSKKQSNGKIISYTLNGDEFISWATSLDGYTLLEKNNGDIVYAVLNEEGKLIKSDVLACDNRYRTIEDNIFLSTIKKGLFFNSLQIERFKQNRVQRYSNNSPNNIPTTGNPNFLVILVSFADMPFNTANVSTMQNQISQTNYTAIGAVGSVKDYFFDNSMGALNANFTVVGPYTLSHNQAYYGAETEYSHDTLPREMVAEACSLANPNVNYANFDNDNDGIVDMIHVIYAGKGQHEGGGPNAIWPHSWTLPALTSFDGVNVNRYSCSNELTFTNSISGIGGICHEMGHVFGLSDFYDTDYQGSGGQAIHLDTWDLMAIGGYIPPYLSALERQILGWLTPINLTASTSNCTLPAISDSNKAYKVALSTNEFLMFEHRNKKKWDAYTPAKGMLVYHGDNNLIYSLLNNINANPYDRGYYIIPAYGDSSNINSTSTTFPGSTNQTSFINSKLKNGTPTGKMLIGIAYGTDSVITFSYVNNAPTVTTNVATNISISSAILNGTITGGSEAIISQGFEYKLSSSSTWTTITTTISGNAITHNLTGLNPNSTYQFRAFVTIASGTIYGTTQNFTTQSITPPMVVTNPATAIAYRTATLNGTITVGDEAITSQGFEYKLSSASTWTPVTTTINGNAITYNLTGLYSNYTYQFKAFATTVSGTVYGSIQSFTTLEIIPPIVITNSATPTSGTTAIFNGIIIAQTETILDQGFKWKQSNASLWEEVSALLNGDTITYELTTLIPNESYKFRAYARTELGVTNGLIKTFTTLELIEAERNEKSVIIHPNPTENKTILRFDGEKCDTDILIYDINGKLVKTLKLKAENNELEIDVQGFEKGVYNIIITNPKLNIIKKLIII